MNVLYLGDIMAEPGIRVVEQLLPELRARHSLDLVVAQGENVTNGKGITPDDLKRLQKAGVDFFTGGNHSLEEESIVPLMEDPEQPIIRPANYPKGTPGLGWKYAHTNKGDILIISLMGGVVGKDANKEVDNPLIVVDEILAYEQDHKKVATIVNLHGDYSSEKLVFGFYLDGRASLVIGDHWHIPSADAMVLPKGTAHITDVGMCGTIYSSLGVKTDTIIRRWRNNEKVKNDIELDGPLQLCGVIAEIDPSTGLSQSIEFIKETTVAK